MASDQPLIVQGVDTLLLEVASSRFEAARSQLLAFAELIKAPEHVHTYRITALSIWNARSAGVTVDQIVATLREFSRYPVPDATLVEIRSHASRFGKLRLLAGDDGLTLESSDDEALEIVRRHRDVSGQKRTPAAPNWPRRWAAGSGWPTFFGRRSPAPKPRDPRSSDGSGRCRPRPTARVY